MISTQSNVVGKGKSPAPGGHLVILVHGMNTRANWIDEVKTQLENSGFSVAATSFGFFGIVRFLSFPFLRKYAVNRVKKSIAGARTAFRMTHGRDPEKMSAIAHSFGTYVISRILVEEPGVVWNRIIFCGSVVKDDFDLDNCFTRFNPTPQLDNPPLLNEVGTRDYWPLFGESAGWGYGSIGSVGLNSPYVKTRWHKGLYHSDFLKPEFCKAHWVPFLRGEKARRVSSPENIPILVRFITAFPLRLLILIFLIGFCFSLIQITDSLYGSGNVAVQIKCFIVRDVFGRDGMDFSRC